MTGPAHATTAYVGIPDNLWLMVEGGQQFVDDIAGQLDPYVARPSDARVPVLSIRERPIGRSFRELQNLAGDGWVTGYDGERLFVIAGRRACSMPDDSGLIEVDQGFPKRRLMNLVRPALQLALLDRGTPVLHAACVEVEGRAVLVAGWSESGKTETALALLEEGGSFVSDKWTLLLPGARAGAFPISVGIRRWVLRYLPQLRSRLPRRARTQLGAAAFASAVVGPAWERSWPAPISQVIDVTRRAIQLGERASLTPGQLRAAYGDTRDLTRTPPIGLVAVLCNSQSAGVGVEDGDAARLAMRMAVSAATEREPFMALRRRAAYAEARLSTMDDVVARDAAALEQVLARVPLIEVTSPFPTDPRDVARVIAARL